jgi:hypothetical protein
MALAILLLLQLLLLLLLDFFGAVLTVWISISPSSSIDPGGVLGVGGCDVEAVRRADSLPAERVIDCEKAARWVKAKGARRVAKARIADMLVVCGV